MGRRLTWSRCVAWTVAMLSASGCVESSSVTCGDGRVCPEGNRCVELTSPPERRCATEEQLAACDGMPDFAACGAGYCHDGVCLPVVCGNDRVDLGEVCDDGDQASGNGCAADCRSDETCGNGVIDLMLDTKPGERCDDSNLVGRDGCASQCQPETLGWLDQTPRGTPQPGRETPAMAFDSVRGRIVLFGGGARTTDTSFTVAMGDTWEGDGEQWYQVVTDVAPLARSASAMAYDPVRRRVVLFGGISGVLLGDTWEWDGRRWTNPASTGPLARQHHAMAYDPSRKMIVMFGGTGSDNMPLDDTWGWDGASWTRIATATTPAARERHGLAFDPKRGVLVMVGGKLAGSAPPDTWELDSNWHQVATSTTPAQLVDSGVAYDRVGARVIAYGGQLNGISQDGTYAWNGTSWSSLGDTGPSTRTAMGIVGDVAGGRVVLYGGYSHTQGPTCPSGGCFSELFDAWNWNGAAWSAFGVPFAITRDSFAYAYDPDRDVATFVGGYTDLSVVFTDTFELHADHFTQYAGPWTGQVAPGSMAYDAVRREAVLFSGFDSNAILEPYLRETWRWRDHTWTKANPSQTPDGRLGGAMAFDVKRGSTILFGGQSNALLDDTWRWDGTTWTQLAPTSKPTGRYDAAFAYDPIREVLVLFGGRTAGYITLGDMWTFDGTTWTQLTPPVLPPARYRAGLAWDGARRALVLVDGFASGTAPLGDVWEWDGTTWRLLTPSDPPPARAGGGVFPGGPGGGIRMFGGTDGLDFRSRGDLWRLTWTGDLDYEQCTLAIDADRDGLSGCADPDCWSSCNPWCPPGAPCDPALPACGDHTCSPVETCHTCPQDCACVPVCGDAACDAGETHASCPGDC